MEFLWVTLHLWFIFFFWVHVGSLRLVVSAQIPVHFLSFVMVISKWVGW